ncbi:hypothetical protein HGRIS_006333 [Hohenbuehelia grisea]|uniref:RlpA-like protein double-psi beta-barrel domain-containing protein n=1 Tax=Hohenbuehelia grisea TaxID=104357 RepID=A0ABR3K0T1_9AGAR
MCRALFFLCAFLFSMVCVSAAPTLEKRLDRWGKGTWYNPQDPAQNGGFTTNACGGKDKDSDLLVAMSTTFFRNNKGVNCNQYVRLTNTANGKVTYARMRDSCVGCGYNDLDMSPATFKKLAPLSQGIVKIKWNFMKKGWKP